MTPPNRAEARAALAELLEAGVTSAQAVYGYQADDFGGQSPVLCVTSRASDRKRLTMGDTRGQATFGFDIHVFVLYRDPASPQDWTPAHAEDALDQIEQEIFAAVLANPKTTAWRAIAYAEPTEARDVVAPGDGAIYLHETIPVAVSVF